MFYDIKYCKKCGKPFDMGTNFDICPDCRKEEINKKREENVKRNR